MERASKSRAAMVSGKGQVIHAARSIHATTKIEEKKYKLNAEKSQIPMDLPALANAGKGKETYVELDEPLAGSGTLITSDLLEESGHGSFSGTSHPPEPVDADMMTTIYAALDQGKPEIGRVVKGTSSKGPCFEGLSIQVQAVRPAAISSTSESLIMEPRGSGTTGGPSFITCNSRSTEISILPSDPGEKECVWDAS